MEGLVNESHILGGSDMGDMTPDKYAERMEARRQRAIERLIELNKRVPDVNGGDVNINFNTEDENR